MLLPLLLLSLMTTSVHYENEAVGVASSCLLFPSLGSILHFIQGMSSRSMVPPAHKPSVAPRSSQFQVLSLAATVPLSRPHLPMGPHFPLTAAELHAFSVPALLQTCWAFQGHPYFAAIAPFPKDGLPPAHKPHSGQRDGASHRCRVNLSSASSNSCELGQGIKVICASISS